MVREKYGVRLTPEQRNQLEHLVRAGKSTARVATRARIHFPAHTLTAAGNTSPSSIWSDETTMWVADSFDDKIYAYKRCRGNGGRWVCVTSLSHETVLSAW